MSKNDDRSLESWANLILKKDNKISKINNKISVTITTKEDPNRYEPCQGCINNDTDSGITCKHFAKVMQAIGLPDCTNIIYWKER